MAWLVFDWKADEDLEKFTVPYRLVLAWYTAFLLHDIQNTCFGASRLSDEGEIKGGNLN